MFFKKIKFNHSFIFPIQDLIEKKDFQKAKLKCQKLLKKYPHETILYYLLGLINIFTNQLEDAKTNFKNCLKINPLLYDSLTHLALIYKNQHNYSQAIIYLNKALSIKPDLIQNYIYLVEIHTHLQNSEKVKYYLNQAQKINPNNLELLKAFASKEIDHQNYSKAINYLTKALHINPEDEELIYNLGLILQKQKKYKDSLICFNKLKIKNPTNDLIYLQLAKSYKNLKNYSLAIANLQKAHILNSKHPSNLQDLPSCSFNLNKKPSKNSSNNYQLPALILQPTFKTYQIDQDKSSHPLITYQKTLKALKTAFPKTKFKLKKIKKTSTYSVYDFTDNFITSHGKGLHSNQSKASAIMEYTERKSWLEFNYQNIPGNKFISYQDFAKLTDLSDIKKCFNLQLKHFTPELEKIIKKIPLNWVPAYNLTQKRSTFYPINLNNMYQGSNALASGNTLEEAIFQATCEAIERHHIDLFIKNFSKISLELIDTTSIKNPLIKNLLIDFQNQNLILYLINITFDISLPTIIACVIDPNNKNKNLNIGYGYGAHSNAEKAIIRAITEYAQAREGLLKSSIANSRIELRKGQWQFHLNLDIQSKLKNAQYIDIKKLPNISNKDISKEIKTIIKILKEKDYDLIICDKTHPKIKIPVVRALIPGLFPGTNFYTIVQNTHFIITALYYQAGLKYSAYLHYLKYFQEILGIYKEIDIFNQNTNSSLFTVNIDNINPSKFPLMLFFQETYIQEMNTIYNLIKNPTTYIQNFLDIIINYQT